MVISNQYTILFSDLVIKAQVQYAQHAQKQIADYFLNIPSDLTVYYHLFQTGENTSHH